MVKLDFICICSAELFGTEREQNIQNKNICLQRNSNPRPAFHDITVKPSWPSGLDIDGSIISVNTRSDRTRIAVLLIIFFFFIKNKMIK